jgi:exopolyphosphatase/guanosine-5'-triphosphate,3'-diphosphate pyrophosphatase
MPTMAAVDIGANSIRLMIARVVRKRLQVLHEDREVVRLVISGVEEGRLIHLGVTANTRTTSRRVLLVDLGGGSCELTISFKGQIEQIHSLPLGAVRLTRQFLQHDPPTHTELDQMRSYIREELGRLRRELMRRKINITFATSGTPAALSDLWSASQGEDTAVVPRTGTQRLAKKLSSLTVEKRRSLRGIGPRRSEIIVAGAHVFAELMSELQLPSFRYLPYGLRDGMLAQMAAEREDIGLRKQLENQRQNAILNLAGHYAIDLRFSSRVADHAERLFKLLSPVHGLPPEYARLLHAAAILHEVGSFVSRAGRRRHTHYILVHSELLGFNPAQRRFIAALARYLGKSKITPTARPVRLLASADRPLLPRAVVLLRLACAMEQGRRGAVLGMRGRVESSRVRLTLLTRPSGAELELWALERERAYFFEVFGRELVCAEL